MDLCLLPSVPIKLKGQLHRADASYDMKRQIWLSIQLRMLTKVTIMKEHSVFAANLLDIWTPRRAQKCEVEVC